MSQAILGNRTCLKYLITDLGHQDRGGQISENYRDPSNVGVKSPSLRGATFGASSPLPLQRSVRFCPPPYPCLRWLPWQHRINLHQQSFDTSLISQIKSCNHLSTPGRLARLPRPGGLRARELAQLKRRTLMCTIHLKLWWNNLYIITHGLWDSLHWNLEHARW